MNRSRMYLYYQARDEHPRDPKAAEKRYHDLLVENGHLVLKDSVTESERGLPCRRSHGIQDGRRPGPITGGEMEAWRAAILHAEVMLGTFNWPWALEVSLDEVERLRAQMDSSTAGDVDG